MLDIEEVKTIGFDENCCVAASAMDAAKIVLSVIFSCAYISVKNITRFYKTKEHLRKASATLDSAGEAGVVRYLAVATLGTNVHMSAEPCRSAIQDSVHRLVLNK